jgi:hypothetical protein
VPDGDDDLPVPAPNPGGGPDSPNRLAQTVRDAIATVKRDVQLPRI